MQYELLQSLSPEEKNIVEAKLFSLLPSLVRRYTSGESSSIPVDTAQEMLNSLYYQFNAYIKDNGYPGSVLLNENAEDIYIKAVSHIQKKIEYGKNLYVRTVFLTSKFCNISISDTLNGIKSFFKFYDFMYFSHLIPGDIDYQLCIPVSEDLLGIDYIIKYLEHLIIEISFIEQFEITKVDAVLKKAYSNYDETILNLFEPVFASSLGLSIIGADIFSLCINCERLNDLYSVFIQLDGNGMKNALATGARGICSILNIKNDYYFIEAALQLYARVKTALENKTLGNIFI